MSVTLIATTRPKPRATRKGAAVKTFRVTIGNTTFTKGHCFKCAQLSGVFHVEAVDRAAALGVISAAFDAGAVIHPEDRSRPRGILFGIRLTVNPDMLKTAKVEEVKS